MDDFSQCRQYLMERLGACRDELGKQHKLSETDRLARHGKVATVLRDINEELNQLVSKAEAVSKARRGFRSRADTQAAGANGKIPACLKPRMHTMSAELSMLSQMLGKKPEYVVYAAMALDMFQVCIGRTTLSNDVQDDSYAAMMDNQWSVRMEEHLRSEPVKKVIRRALELVPGGSFEDCVNDLWALWRRLNVPTISCDCRQCKVRRGFDISCFL